MQDAPKGVELPGGPFARLLSAMRRARPADVPQLMEAAASDLGGSDVVVYLVDFGQEVLEPLDGSAARRAPPEEVGTTLAGRAFLQRRATSAPRADGTRVWVPIMAGSEPTGVLALTLPSCSEDALGTCEDLGILCGYMIAAHSRTTDVYTYQRRRRTMSLGASMLWDLLPPLAIEAKRVTAAGMVEPAYEVGGDCFDYAHNGETFEVAVMDSMGHGVASATVAALALSAYRHERRQGLPLERIHHDLDGVVASHGGETFVTGQLGHLELGTGRFRWLNAGHPPPLLIRGGRVVAPLECPPALPWGLGPSEAKVASASLEPGDLLLFYTDGTVEARGAAQQGFGLDRLADLAGQHASDQLPVTTIVRLVLNAVLEHHAGRLRDDATVLLLRWEGPEE